MYRPSICLQGLRIGWKKDQCAPLSRLNGETQLIKFRSPAFIACIEVYNDSNDTLTSQIGPFAPPRRRCIIMRCEYCILWILCNHGCFEWTPCVIRYITRFVDQCTDEIAIFFRVQCQRDASSQRGRLCMHCNEFFNGQDKYGCHSKCNCNGWQGCR